jgi:hypothetical protein
VILNLKVLAVDQRTARATLVDPEEIDDVVMYGVFMPSHFGGEANPWPKVGEYLHVRYEGGSSFRKQPIQDVWRER